MPKPAHTLVTWSGIRGSVASPVDDWSFSLRFGYQEFLADADRQAAAQAMRDAYGHLSTRLRPDTLLTRVRVAQVRDGRTVDKNADGEYMQADWADVPYPGDKAGGATMPLQTALCVSLTTDRAGATGKGRFFLPFPGYSLGADYRLSVADTEDLALAVGSFLEACRAAGISWNAGGNIVVASSYGYASVVRGFKIGRAPDTMRSRRSDVDEGYVERQLA